MPVQLFSGAAEFYETAPAKINLALHVVGQRADGYHLLETLVTFADAGDQLSFVADDADRFSISGPFSAVLANNDGLADNLVLGSKHRPWPFIWKRTCQLRRASVAVLLMLQRRCVGFCGSGAAPSPLKHLT
jgi:hypothetical protein